MVGKPSPNDSEAEIGPISWDEEQRLYDERVKQQRRDQAYAKRLAAREGNTQSQIEQSYHQRQQAQQEQSQPQEDEEYFTLHEVPPNLIERISQAENLVSSQQHELTLLRERNRLLNEQALKVQSKKIPEKDIALIEDCKKDLAMCRDQCTISNARHEEQLGENNRLLTVIQDLAQAVETMKTTDKSQPQNVHFETEEAEVTSVIAKEENIPVRQIPAFSSPKPPLPCTKKKKQIYSTTRVFRTIRWVLQQVNPQQ